MPQDMVKTYYNSNVDMEKNRLAKDAYHQIEFEVTKHFIDKYSKAGDHIIDIGGGPGRYTKYLLSKQFSTTLVDLSPGLLEEANNSIKAEGLHENFKGTYERCATDLKEIADNSYNLTLLLGPMYHLVNQEDREKAIAEAKRVTKPGGLIFTAIINWLTPFRDMMFGSTESYKYWLSDGYDDHEDLLQSQSYIPQEVSPKGFTAAYFSKIDEVPKMYSKFNIETVETFSCEGIASFLDDKAEIYNSCPQVWQRFLDTIIKTSTEPSILGSGEHTVFIGRKVN